MPEDFRHPSTLHGQAHVTRVMVHATRLVAATGRHELGPRLWAAVFCTTLLVPTTVCAITMEPTPHSACEPRRICKAD